MCLRNGCCINLTHLAYFSVRRYQIMSPLYVVAYLDFSHIFVQENSWNIMIYFAFLTLFSHLSVEVITHVWLCWPTVIVTYTSVVQQTKGTRHQYSSCRSLETPPAEHRYTHTYTHKHTHTHTHTYMYMSTGIQCHLLQYHTRR